MPCLSPSGTSEKTFGDKLYFWKKSERSNLTVSFMGGSQKLHNRVAKIANKWVEEGGAGLTFNFLPQGTGMIRVSFGDSGHWSQIGRVALKVPKAEPTMNLMVRDTTRDDELQRVVLHEFGHALGLMHEHRQPGNPIIWNKPVVRKFYSGAPNYWNDEQIEEQVFKPYNSSTAISNGYDPDSIMHYPVLKGWTLNKPEIVVDWNRKLTKADKDFISSPAAYPKL